MDSPDAGSIRYYTDRAVVGHNAEGLQPEDDQMYTPDGDLRAEVMQTRTVVQESRLTGGADRKQVLGRRAVRPSGRDTERKEKPTSLFGRTKYSEVYQYAPVPIEGFGLATAKAEVDNSTIMSSFMERNRSKYVESMKLTMHRRRKSQNTSRHRDAHPESFEQQVSSKRATNSTYCATASVSGQGAKHSNYEANYTYDASQVDNYIKNWVVSPAAAGRIVNSF